MGSRNLYMFRLLCSGLALSLALASIAESDEQSIPPVNLDQGVVPVAPPLDAVDPGISLGEEGDIRKDAMVVGASDGIAKASVQEHLPLLPEKVLLRREGIRAERTVPIAADQSVVAGAPSLDDVQGSNLREDAVAQNDPDGVPAAN